MLNTNKLGKRIKQTRRAKHITAEAFAEKIEISVSFLREIERESKRPSIVKFVEIANALEVSADYLLKDSINVSEPLILQRIAQELDGLPTEQINFIEEMVIAMKLVFESEENTEECITS